MRWSKLKQQVELRFADSVQGRVKVCSTRYRKPDSSTGRGWLEVDGVEIVNFSTMDSGRIYRCFYNEVSFPGMGEKSYATHAGPAQEDREPGNLAERGEFSRFDLHHACWDSLNLSVDDAMASENPLIRSLAYLDRRLGKRRLARIHTSTGHPMSDWFLAYRRQAESITGPSPNEKS